LTFLMIFAIVCKNIFAFFIWHDLYILLTFYFSNNVI
jgi:hypothetical protein